MLHKTTFFVLILLFSAVGSFAQTKPRKIPRGFFELGVSANSYKGDLSHSYNEWANGLHFGVLFNKKKRINGHFNFMIGSAVAQNPNYFFDDGSDPQPTPNEYARTTMFAFNYDLHVNLYKKNGLIVYLYQGLGLIRFDPLDTESKQLQDQLNTRAEGENYSNTCFMLPHGLGILYVHKPGFGFGFQAGFMNPVGPSSDYIDNVSEWGDRKKKDNILSYKITAYIPFRNKNKQADLVPDTY